MARLDGLRWEAGIALDLHGVRLGIRVNHAPALNLLVERLPFGWRPASSPLVDSLYSLILGGPSERRGERRYHMLYHAWQRLARTLDQEEVLRALTSGLDSTVAARASDRVFVHAGVVAWRGQAIMFPGRSLSGKTTLVAALVRAGATYYSDEYAVLDGAGLVHPYPRPLGLREPGTTGAGTPVPVEQLGGLAGRDPVRVGLIVDTIYAPAARWSPVRLSPAEGLLRVLDNTVVARTRPQLALSLLGRVVRQAIVLRGERGEANDVAVQFLRLAEADVSTLRT